MLLQVGGERGIPNPFEGGEMIDLKDIVPALCDECSECKCAILEAFMIIGRDETFCSHECAEQFITSHNVDEAERKGEI